MLYLASMYYVVILKGKKCVCVCVWEFIVPRKYISRHNCISSPHYNI